VNHGFLGTIGGAIMGSLTEDFIKDKKHSNQDQAQGSQGGYSQYFQK
jgi:hypothetical protein